MRRVCLVFLLATASVAVPAAAQDKGLGLVTQNNVAVMLVDPNPAYAGARIEGGNGTTADGAIYRYRSGQLTPLLPLSGKSAIGAAGAAQGAGASVNRNQAGGPR